MNQAVMVCPACGQALSVPIRLQSVKVFHSQLAVTFAGTTVEHCCKGMDA